MNFTNLMKLPRSYIYIYTFSKKNLCFIPLLCCFLSQNSNFISTWFFQQISTSRAEKKNRICPDYKTQFNRPGVSFLAARLLVIWGDDPVAIGVRRSSEYRVLSRSWDYQLTQLKVRAKLACTLSEVDCLLQRTRAFLNGARSRCIDS